MQIRYERKAMDRSSQKPIPSRSPEPALAISRRSLLRAGMGGAGLVGAAAIGVSLKSAPGPDVQAPHVHGQHVMPAVVCEVDHARNGFNPTELLTDFDAGKISVLPNGQTLHEYTFAALDKAIEVVPGLEFAAWT